VWDSLRRADRVFSTYRADSDITRIDRGELAVPDADPMVAPVLELAERARLATAGAFDVRYAGRLDPSGIVKGWAASRAAELIVLPGADWYLNAGGDVMLRSASGQPWRVGIEHPTEREALSAVLELADGAVATSGGAHRGRHIVDPATGSAATGVLQATVYGPDLVWADMFATAIVAGGPPRAWTLPDGYRYLLIPG
jgi:thiamine biosynthesis lipoprotein